MEMGRDKPGTIARTLAVAMASLAVVMMALMVAAPREPYYLLPAPIIGILAAVFVTMMPLSAEYERHSWKRAALAAAILTASGTLGWWLLIQNGGS